MTYEEICARLEAAGIEEARHDAALLICHFGGISPATLPYRRGEDIESPALTEAVARRAGRYPLQYLIGTWGFCSQEYEVNEHTLIPRPDTECLVEQAVKLLPRGARFADLCTGSGCIAISTACLRRDTTAIAVDLFPETLEVARRNAVRNGVAERVSFRQADVLCPMDIPAGSLDAILSNPPYIRTEVVGTLAAELAHEPAAALDGGADGLDFYRAILTWHAPLLKPEGFFLFEIGYDQGEALRALAGRYGYTCHVIRDLGGQDRVAVVRRAETAHRLKEEQKNEVTNQ